MHKVKASWLILIYGIITGANDKSSYVIGSDYIQHQTFSYALRFNYSYKGRYMLTVSNRWDGDSRLSKGNKWASFLQ